MHLKERRELLLRILIMTINTNQVNGDTMSWWVKPMKISIVVDNDSWILPYAKNITETIVNIIIPIMKNLAE